MNLKYSVSSSRGRLRSLAWTSGQADKSSTMATIPTKTSPPTLRQQPSICPRSKDLPTVLPFATISILEPSGTGPVGPLSTHVTVPKRPWSAKRFFASALIFFSPVSNSSRDCVSSMASSHPKVLRRMIRTRACDISNFRVCGPHSPMGFISACQSGDKRSDFVPGFAGYDRLAFLDLGRGEIQSGRSCIRDNRKSGDAGRSLEAPRLTWIDWASIPARSSSSRT